MLHLVDGDAIGVDLHRQAGEGAGVLHLAHTEDRDRLQERPHPRADDLIADLRGVLPGKDRLEAGRSSFGEHPRDRRREHVMRFVDQQRDTPALRLGKILLRLQSAVEYLEEELRDDDRVVLADRGLRPRDGEDLAAFEDTLQIDPDRMPEQRVDFARGDQSLELVARRIKRLGGVAAVDHECRELVLPVIQSEGRPVDGVALDVATMHRDGTKHPILFLHGFGSTKEDYADIARHGAFDGHSVLAMTPRAAVRRRAPTWPRSRSRSSSTPR